MFYRWSTKDIQQRMLPSTNTGVMDLKQKALTLYPGCVQMVIKLLKH